MKQFFTFATTALMFLGSVCASNSAYADATEYVDHISPAALKAQNPEGNFEALGYADTSCMNSTLTLTGESGAKYELKNVITDGTSFWALGNGGCVATSESEKYIKSVQIVGYNYLPDYMILFTSGDAISSENKWDASFQYIYRNGSGYGGSYPLWTADANFKYMYFDTTNEWVGEIVITYVDEAPVLFAPKPVITLEGDPVPGAIVHIQGAEGYTTNVDLRNYSDWTAEYPEINKDYTEANISFALPGKPGDQISISAYCHADGYRDSERAGVNYTLIEPKAAMPRLVSDVQKAVAGTTFTLACDTEGATISCSLELFDWDNRANDRTYDPVLGMSPLTVTIPADARPGNVIRYQAYAVMEGYRQSETLEEYITIISDVLAAPTFSLEDGAEVEPGTTLTIMAAERARGFRYTVNGGEEQTCEGASATITVNEDTAVEAWSIGEAPYKDSPKVSVSVKLEQFGEGTDVIVPECFTDNAAELNSGEVKKYTYRRTVDADRNEYITYVYNGALVHDDYVGRNVFWFTNGNYGTDTYTGASILYNETPVEGGIRRVRLDGTSEWTACYLLLSDRIVTEADYTNHEFDFTNDGHYYRLRVGGVDSADMPYYEWIDFSQLEDLEFVPAHIAVYSFGSTQTMVNRVMVDTGMPDVTGVRNVMDVEGAEVIYTLDGVKVDGRNLAPGIYVRKAGNKSSKFVVK